MTNCQRCFTDRLIRKVLEVINENLSTRLTPVFHWQFDLSCSKHFLKCFFTSGLYLKHLSHKPQMYCFTSVCTVWCTFSSCAVQKRFEQSLQTYGFTPSWRSKCRLRWHFVPNFFQQMSHVNQVPSPCDFKICTLSCLDHVKLLEHCEHEYGFAPVWTRTWLFKSLPNVNCRPQYGQWYGFLVVCIQRLCLSKAPERLKLLSQSKHLYGFSPVWTLMWLFRFVFWQNALSQSWHL